MFGSKSGFDTVKECFKERTSKIHAIETGLSSDPEMNWRLSQLDDFSILSFSDSHSYWPWRLGREATIFELDKLSYDKIIDAIKTKQGLRETIEVDPGYGKYHYDGHRNCSVSLSPQDSNKLSKLCPKCGKPLTIGVENRVEELADRPHGFKPDNEIPFSKLIPLSELISTISGKGIATKSTWSEYYKLVGKLGSEYDILRKVSKEELEKYVDHKLVEVILKNRNQQIKVIPGYDGVYGIPVIDKNQKIDIPEFEVKEKQTGLGDYA
jgi:uncharacterized protein (TIGR00375 family)